MTLSVVVTGASGFIGNALVKKLKNEPAIEVVPVSRSGIDATHICVDNYRDTPTGDVLVHVAEDPLRARANLAGETYRKKSGLVMEALLTKGYGKVIYCSSAVVYGDNGNRPYSEESSVEPTDNYVRAKLENERRVLAIDGIVARFANVIGPKMHSNTVIPDILEQLSGEDPIIVHNERPVRDFIWLDDLVAGLQILITQGMSGTYNIGSGQGTSVRELAQIALSITGQQSRTINSVVASPSPSFIVLNNNKMKQMYGWSPTKNIYQCIERLIYNKQLNV